MNSKTFAYVRVSTQEQNIDRQYNAIYEYCRDNNITLNERDIYTDKASGKDFNREAYKALKHNLREGDTLIIKELDRLGRDMLQIKEEWHDIVKAGVNIIVIDTPILSTTNKTDLEKNLISNIVFELLAYMSQKERLKIKQRQAEGIAAAKAKGMEFGRPKAKYPDNFAGIYYDWKAQKFTAVQAMQILGLKKSTFYKLVKQFEKNNA